MEVAVIKKQSPLAVEEVMKLLQSDVIYTTVLVHGDHFLRDAYR